MSELNPEIARNVEQGLLAAGKSAEEVAKTLAILEKAAKKVGISLQDFDKFNKELKKNTTTMGGLFKEMATGRQQYKDLNSTLHNLNNSIEEMEDKIDQANDAEKLSLRLKQEQLIASRIALQQVVAHNTAQRLAVDNMKMFGAGMASASGIAAKTLGGFAKGLQDGSSAFGLAGGLMEGAIDGMNVGAQTVGGSMQAAGTAMSTSVNPKIRTLGIVSGVAGSAVKSLGDAAAATGKFIVGFLVKQLEQTVEAFNKTSATGAMFADGMTGMVNAAGDAGLTVKQFSGVLEKNSDDISKSGMGMTEGARRIGSALKSGGKEMQTSLLKLGYGFEEQAGLVAETMATMKGSTVGPLRATDAQIADQTQKYAENLRVITAITGEDAKKKIEQVKQQASQLAFQQKLASKSPEQQAAVVRAMANMSDIERKNFMDMVNFGSVINKEGAIAQATSRGLTESVSATYKAYQEGTLDEVKQREIATANTEQIKKDMLANTGIATAQAAGVGGTIGAVGEALGKELEFRNKMTPEAIAAADELAKSQKNANDQLTTNTVSAARAAQQMAVDLQNLVLPQLSKFAELSASILGELQKQLKSFTKHTDDQDRANWKVMTFWEKLTSGLDRVAEFLVGIVDTVTGGAASGLSKLFGGKTLEEVKQQRVAKETRELTATGRQAGPAAATPAGPLAGAQGSPLAGPPVSAAQPGVVKLADFLKFGPGTGSEDHFNKLDPGVRGNFIALAQEYYGQTGRKLQINSAFRTPEEQAAVDSGGNPKAAPGKSLHNVGRALDINSSQVADLKAMGLLGKHGFSPLDGDPPHIQALDKGGSIEGSEVALVGEKGPELIAGPASVTSRSDTSELFKKMNGNLEAMLRVLKEQQSTSEKILWATS